MGYIVADVKEIKKHRTSYRIKVVLSIDFDTDEVVLNVTYYIILENKKFKML